MDMPSTVGMERYGRNAHNRLRADSISATNHYALPDDLKDLEARVAKMRELGVTKWGDIELGPPPASAETGEIESVSLADMERKAREERRRVAIAASGGPTRRVDE